MSNNDSRRGQSSRRRQPGITLNTVNSTWKKLADNHQFRWLIAGNTALFFGFFATMLLRSLLAWELTGDEMVLAYINLATAICMFAVSLVSGVIIDRCERRLMILLAQSAVLVAETGILVLLLMDRLSFEFLLLSAVAASLAFPFIMPARTAMLVATVGKRPLVKATAILSAGMNVARTVSPAIVGFLADWGGFILCYLRLVGLHLLSLLCTAFLERRPPGDSVRSGFFDEMLEGYRYLFRHRSLGMAIVFGIFPMLIVVPLQNMMVVFVNEIWDAGGSGLGIMMATMGAGGVAGSLLLTRLPDDSLTKPMVIGTLCMGAFLLLFAHSANFWLAVVMVMGISSCSVIPQTLVQSAVQLMSDDYIRGRITTITLMSFSLTPVGTLPLAYAVKHVGAQWGLTIAATLLTLGVLLMWKGSEAFRRIDLAAKGSH